MFGRDVFEAAVDGLAEFGESRVVFPIENVTFDKLPQPFDQVQIQRIRWQELELDIECGRQILHHSTVLIRFPIPPESINAIARNMAMLMWALRDRNTDKPIKNNELTPTKRYCRNGLGRLPPRLRKPPGFMAKLN